MSPPQDRPIGAEWRIGVLAELRLPQDDFGPAGTVLPMCTEPDPSALGGNEGHRH